MGLKRRGIAWLIALLVIGSGLTGLSARAQSAPPDDPAYEFQWALGQIGAVDAWSTGRGRGATVAVLDTGAHLEHEDLAGQLLNGIDFVNNDRVAQDDNGQGTHMAGVIAATTNNGRGIAGVAPQARILPVKVLDEDGDGTEAHLLAGIRHAIERKVQVIVMELDSDTTLSNSGQTFRTAIENAWEAGAVPVVASEHEFVRSQGFATAPALVVTGLTREGEPAAYSEGVGAARWGLAAPGGTGNGNEDDIFSTYWPHTRRSAIGGTQEFGRYAYFADNEVAAAHVAGAAAILRGLGQTPAQTVRRLLDNATEAGPRGRDQSYGSGVLHVQKAVEGLPPDPRDRPRPTSTTSTTAAAGTAGTPGQGQGDVRPSQGSRPPAASPSAPAEGPTAGTPAGATPASEPAASLPEDPEVDDLTGGLAAQGGEPVPGKLPVLPMVAFLLLVGSGTITWAMRRRTVDAPPDL